MAGQHGLGRGLSSLIPQKKIGTQTEAEAGVETVQDALDAKREMRARAKSAPVSRAYPPSHKKPGSAVHSSESTASTESTALTQAPHAAQEVAIAKIIVNSQQPRSHFDEEKLDELAQSIRSHGIIQPLIVTPTERGYELIAGERRLQAAKRADLTMVPVSVNPDAGASEQKKLEIALIENIQRHDLNAVEEARAYKKLAEEFDLSQADIAKRTGKSRSAIANRMRLLNLPIEVQRALIAGKITEGHAKAILALDHPEKQRALFELIVSQKLTVRESEQRAHDARTTGTAVRAHQRSTKSAHLVNLETALSDTLDMTVRIAGDDVKGKMVITYKSPKELRSIADRLE